jgi:hypothetical protein
MEEKKNAPAPQREPRPPQAREERMDPAELADFEKEVVQGDSQRKTADVPAVPPPD